MNNLKYNLNRVSKPDYTRVVNSTDVLGDTLYAHLATKLKRDVEEVKITLADNLGDSLAANIYMSIHSGWL